VFFYVLPYAVPRATGAAIAPPPSLMDLEIPAPDFLVQKQAAGRLPLPIKKAI
jgi:hypothetical protein